MPAATPCQPTHAGGLVYRFQDTQIQYLVVQAKGNPEHWILPKGHIEPGETPEQTAVRELAEETGVVAGIVTELGYLRFSVANRLITTVYYLMRYQTQVTPQEERLCRWLPYDAALRLLTFPATRDLLRQAHAFLCRQSPSRGSVPA